LNKSELIAAVAKEAGVSKAEAEKIVNATISSISKALAKGEKITLIGFGTFDVAKRKATTGRNPRTGEPIKIPARNVPKFSAGSKLKEAVN